MDARAEKPNLLEASIYDYDYDYDYDSKFRILQKFKYTSQQINHVIVIVIVIY